ncbi:hypothetical protein [Pseudoxanthomonas winnipegensis]|uniref:hypothetical protein n=1 Tax=Pseudoxanthomonas winnipegensis TaxID=2480810 RepID=UPI00103DE9D5|nr:hypothetical protein [Pseudoxanthomonas winnipegensis]TBV76852.1 hypothetical protein EYC45_01420 [Pseudoxanthomonas winnipegensis]
MSSVYHDGFPAVEAVMPLPRQDGMWPLVSQAVIVPWEVTDATGDCLEMDSLQVMIVPRAEWERLQAKAADRQ